MPLLPPLREIGEVIHGILSARPDFRRVHHVGSARSGEDHSHPRAPVAEPVHPLGSHCRLHRHHSGAVLPELGAPELPGIQLCRHPHRSTVRHHVPRTTQRGQLQGYVPPCGRYVHAQWRRRDTPIRRGPCARRHPHCHGVPGSDGMVPHLHARRLRGRPRHRRCHWLGIRGRRLGRGDHRGPNLCHVRLARRHHQRHYRHQLLRQPRLDHRDSQGEGYARGGARGPGARKGPHHDGREHRESHVH